MYRSTELDALPWLIHGFGTRQSDIPGRFANLATVKQIHSAICVAAEGRCGILGQGDALLEDRPGAVIAIKTADCIPIRSSRDPCPFAGEGSGADGGVGCSAGPLSKRGRIEATVAINPASATIARSARVIPVP